MQRARPAQCTRNCLSRDLLFRALLVASLWHAPVPWIHIHGSQEAGASSNVFLDRHLDEFHSNFERSQVEELGWHVHYVLPWNIHHKGNCEKDRNGQHCDDFLAGVKYSAACAPQHGMDAALSSTFPCSGDWVPLDFAASSASFADARILQSEAGPPTSYFASFLGSVSICDLIDRHLC